MAVQPYTVDHEDVARFSRIAEEWWDENGKFRPLHRIGPVRVKYIRDRVCAHFGRDAEKINSLAGLRLVDIGCGGGLMCEPMTRMGAQVTGIDASEKNIAVAALHAEKMGLGIDYLATTPEQLSDMKEQAEKYDIVLALEIVEHVADVPAFLAACAALVKPGGILFVSTLNRSIKSYALAIVGAEYVLRWLPRGTHNWKQFLKPSELAAEIRQSGLLVTHMSGIVFNPLRREWSLNARDLDVNYILSADKPA